MKKTDKKTKSPKTSAIKIDKNTNLSDTFNALLKEFNKRNKKISEAEGLLMAIQCHSSDELLQFLLLIFFVFNGKNAVNSLNTFGGYLEKTIKFDESCDISPFRQLFAIPKERLQELVKLQEQVEKMLEALTKDN